jgi:hypothetical protein
VDTFESADALLIALRTHLMLCERAGTWSRLSGIFLCEGRRYEVAVAGEDRLLTISIP